MSLTAADRQTIQATWAKLFGTAEENGRLILIRFFTDHPEGKKYFRSILTEGDLRTNRELGFHSKRVMEGLDQMIASLGDRTQLGTLVGRLVQSHRDKHRVPPGMFQSVLNVCQDLFGEAFSGDTRTSWQKLFGTLQEEIQTAYSSQPKA
ncbi:hypothetical protein lerEdw1_004541 [Lerista edwardsae]|nr:hypothetical protein lerEdw1_004541 [Lerista edwardsae]